MINTVDSDIIIINKFSKSKLLTVDHYLYSNRSIRLNGSMKLYININIILKYFYFCNHSCDIHIFDVLYRLYKCSSMHVKTFRFPEFSNSRHCRQYRSSYMKDRQGGWVRHHICFHCPPPIESVPLRRCNAFDILESSLQPIFNTKKCD